MKKILFISAAVLLCAAALAPRKKKKIDTTTVKDLDVKRYMGRWYEIARFNHPFERGMTDVSAMYKERSNGTVSVLNSGYKHNRYKEIHGTAWVPDPNRPGQLKVSFFPLIASDYWIYELDRHYKYVLVGSSSPKYLWIMCRTPTMPSHVLKHLLREAAHRGYDIRQLIFIDQRRASKR